MSRGKIEMPTVDALIRSVDLSTAYLPCEGLASGVTPVARRPALRYEPLKIQWTQLDRPTLRSDG